MTNSSYGVVTLRKLAWQSVLKFGRYADMTVRQVYEIKERSYLWWCYYNLENIDFLEDILVELMITEEWRISKPGKNPDIEDRFIEEVVYKEYSDKSDLDNFKHAAKKKKLRNHFKKAASTIASINISNKRRVSTSKKIHAGRYSNRIGNKRGGGP